MNEKPDKPLHVGLISLGCAKNLVDAEIMLGALLRDGVQITNQASEADVVIVNTCSFIDAAQEESVDTILESVEVREANQRGQALVVAGCLSQRFREELPKLLPEVDAFMGIDQVASVTDIVRQALGRRRARTTASAPPKGAGHRAAITGRIQQLAAGDESAEESASSLRGTPQFGKTRTVLAAPQPPPLMEVNRRPTFIPDYATPRFRLTPRHFAYLKIAEGCNHPCSFCIIPQMRGSHRSRPVADIVEEAKALLADGVKELNLISQDSTYYGLDLRPNHSRAIASPARFQEAVGQLPADAPTLAALLRALNALPGDFWIRVLYTHPAHWTDELIAAIRDCRKVTRYVDIPLQHIHENMLERMRRETSREHIERLLERIRAGVPGITLRTTFIVGFPGETEAYYQSLVDFVRRVRFERMGVFAYSREEGTRAGRMSGQISKRVRQERRAALMAVQRPISRQVARTYVGTTLKVLAESHLTESALEEVAVRSWEHGLLRGTAKPMRVKGPCTLARAEADAPDIDGRVYVVGHLPPGRFARVKVVGHTDYDLLAEPV
jgi:ribosomal protein S12 methylthiotransferase